MSKCWYCNNELTTGDNPKHFGICNKCYNEMFKSGNTIIRSFTNKIADLEAKLSEKQKENATLEAMLVENANDRKTMQEFKIGEDEYDLTDEDARNSLCWEVEELKQQLAEKEKYTYTSKEVGKIERKYDNKINALKQQLKCQPVEIVEKIIYHYDLNQIRDQFKKGFYGDARCVAIDGFGLIVYLEEMLKEYQK